MHTGKVKIAAAAKEKHPRHLLGKEQIYEWAQQCGWEPQLEPYLKPIAQRPDVLVHIHGQPMALEFQCSPLSAQRLQERNDGYHSMGIGVYWLLGPTYRRHLREGIISQFTQMSEGQPHLAFWRLDFKQIEICRDYSLPAYTNRVLTPNDLRLSQTQKLQRHMHYLDKLWRPLVQRAYIAGHQLSACPLVAHPTVPHWPLLEHGELYWRLSIILRLAICQPGIFWNKEEWFRWLIQQGHWLPTPCLSANSRQQLINQFVDQFTAELAKTGIIKCEKDKIQLSHLPQWFNNDVEKIKHLLN